MTDPTPTAVGSSPDVVIIGGGIVGVAAAAHLAERGRRALLVERATIGAGASGRNSGIVQHPLDPVLGPFYDSTVELYRRLPDDHGKSVDMPAAPVGLLSVTHDPEMARQEATLLARDLAELKPVYLDPHELRILEPSFSADIAACRLDIGFPVAPIAATRAYAAWAEEMGVRIMQGVGATPWIEGSRTRGVRLDDGTRVAAADVVVAAGPWSPSVVDPGGRWRPIRPLWGVVVGVRLPQAPHHIAEEAASAISDAGSGDGLAHHAAGFQFSLVTAVGSTSLGSCFVDREPDPGPMARVITARAASFVPGVASAARVGVRMCARPLSRDGRPLIGRIGWVDGLWIAAGHGPWGISTGPGTARLLADLMTGRAASPPTALDPSRFGTPGDHAPGRPAA